MAVYEGLHRLGENGDHIMLVLVCILGSWWWWYCLQRGNSGKNNLRGAGYKIMGLHHRLSVISTQTKLPLGIGTVFFFLLKLSFLTFIGQS